VLQVHLVQLDQLVKRDHKAFLELQQIPEHPDQLVKLAQQVKQDHKEFLEHL